MYWLLLPPDANAGRHLADEIGPSSGFWTNLLQAAWERILYPLASSRH